MSLASLPLSYCTNVHPARSLQEVFAGLDEFTIPIRAACGQPLAAGLWLARSVVNDLQTAADRRRLADFLQERDLTCYTLNAFPYGDFHSDRVKEQVYLPDWTTEDRLRYTLDCARVLADLLPEGVDGSISTVPLGFKALATSAGFMDRCCERLVQLAAGLDQLFKDTGRVIRLAIEPEPLCVLETTPETIAFFRQLQDVAEQSGQGDAVRQYLGVCYDVCHQSVEFEDVAASIAALHQAGIRINKVHLSCAIEARNVTGDAAVREALARYIEPRYLHQTFARTPGGTIATVTDLDAATLTQPSAGLATADIWRVHFHVPINADTLGPLQTTRPDLRRALPAVRELPYAPHLEVETYTWEVMPDGGKPQVIPGFARELRAAYELVRESRCVDCQG